MEVYKALAMEQYAKENGLGSVRYDQRAIGKSTGERKTTFRSTFEKKVGNKSCRLVLDHNTPARI